MKKFFLDFIIYGFASVLAKVAAILLMPLYTNILTKEEYGAMALIASCKGILDLFSNLNIHSGVSRDYYEKNIDRKKIVSTGFFATVGISICLLVFMILTSHFWTDTVLEIPKYHIPFILMLLSIPSGSFQLFFSLLTRFKKKPLLFFCGTLLQLFIQIGISVVGVVVLKKGIASIFLGALIGEIFVFFYFFWINRSLLQITFEKKYLRRILIFSLPTLPAIMAGWVDSSLGQIIIGKYISIEELAVYSVALQFASVFTLISGAFQNVWSPYLYENYKDAGFKRQSSNIFKLMALSLLFITICLSLLSKEVIILLSNSGYVAASLYIPLLCAPMAILLLFPFASSGVTISRQTKHIATSYVVGSILNVVTLFIFLPRFGILVVPIALCLSRLFTFIYLMKKSSQTLNIDFPNILITIILIVSVCGFIINQMNVDILYRIILLPIIVVSAFFYGIKNRYFNLLFLKK